jgi:arabinose-5-phosphate isomerase
VALLDARGFKAEDFARSHPGGALGRKLLTHVRDLMRSGEALPRVAPATPFTDMMRTMSAKALGLAVVVDADDRVQGVFTDGDLRRLIEQGRDLRALTAAEVASANPRTVGADALAVDAADLMEAARITVVLVVDEQRHLLGAVSINDLMRAKVI